MAEAGARDLLKAGDPGLRNQLVAGHRVIDVGGDPQRLGKCPCHQPPQVGGVVKHRVVPQAVGQVVIHQIAAGHDVGDDAAPAHHRRQGGQVYPLLGQPAPHQGHPVIQLVIQAGVGGQVLVGVDDVLHGRLALPVIDGGLGTGGAGIQYQQSMGHDLPPVSCIRPVLTGPWPQRWRWSCTSLPARPLGS